MKGDPRSLQQFPPAPPLQPKEPRLDALLTTLDQRLDQMFVLADELDARALRIGYREVAPTESAVGGAPRPVESTIETQLEEINYRAGLLIDRFAEARNHLARLV